MKKLFVALLAILLIFSVAACAKPTDKPDDSTPATSPAGPETDKTPGTSAAPATDPVVVTEPPVTEPPVPVPPTSGYCAVGEVDAANNRVAVLYGNGIVSVLTLAGEAPKAGSICYFEREDDLIAFSSITLTDYTMWRVFSDNNGSLFYNTDGTTEWRIYLNTDAVTFLKFSNTGWSAFEGKNPFNMPRGLFQYDNTAWPSNLWVLDGDGDGTIDLVVADATRTYDNGEVTDVTLLFDPTGEGLTEGDHNVVLTAES